MNVLVVLKEVGFEIVVLVFVPGTCNIQDNIVQFLIFRDNYVLHTILVNFNITHFNTN